MKYRVTGSNRNTGARVIMELDANNRADAERKAAQAGMEVLHVEPIGLEVAEPVRHSSHRGEFPEESRLGKWAAVIILLVVVVVIVAYVWMHRG